MNTYTTIILCEFFKFNPNRCFRTLSIHYTELAAEGRCTRLGVEERDRTLLCVYNISDIILSLHYI